MAARAFCFPKSNPNPLAPPWRFPSEWTSETPAGYRDEYQLYTTTTVLTAGLAVTTILNLDTQGQCNFYWREFGVFLFAGAGVPAVRIRDSEGFMMTNTRVALTNGAPFGNQDTLTPIFVAHRMGPGAQLTFDLHETGGVAGVTVLFLVVGVKRWKYDSNLDGRGGSFGPDSPFSAGNPGVPGSADTSSAAAAAAAGLVASGAGRL